MKTDIIDELASQAKSYARDYIAECKVYGYTIEHDEYTVRFQQKLAELIVQQCCSIDFQARLGVSEQSAREIRALIENHFGIENDAEQSTSSTLDTNGIADLQR
jgi:hypothetical protein